MAKKTTLEQELHHKAFASHQLSLAWVSLRASEKLCHRCAATGNVQSALIRDAIVLYGSAFTESRLGNGQSCRLPEERYVPEQFRKLHDRLMTYRHRSFAHCDVEFRKPRRSFEYGYLSWCSDAKGPSDFAGDIPSIITLIGQVTTTLGNELVKGHQKLSGQYGESGE